MRETLLRALRRRSPPIALGTFISLPGIVAAAVTWRRRDRWRRVADEQASLRHLATLVARSAPPAEVFNAVAREMARVLGAKRSVIVRYEDDHSAVSQIGGWNHEQIMATGSRWDIEKDTISELMLRTTAPVRVGTYTGTGPLATTLREAGVVSAVGCPITVGGRLWGVAIVSTTTHEAFAPDTERRMAAFTELAATAIANAQSHADLKASRARVVASADEVRRRIERDLHDGAQQRLISLSLELQRVRACVPSGMDWLADDLANIARIADEAVTELQETCRGLHPAILSKCGLARALYVLARRSAVPVGLTVDLNRRLPERLEMTLYYIVSEALTNIAKHARAAKASVEVTTIDDTVRLRIRDDGVGGADSARGSGLIGLRDRVEALDGRLDVSSSAGEGTTLTVELPTGVPAAT